MLHKILHIFVITWSKVLVSFPELFYYTEKVLIRIIMYN